MDLDLKRRTIIVTGSASGIGRACCEVLRHEGARVVGWDLAATDDDDSCQVDVTDPRKIDDAIQRTVALATAADAPLSGLVHAAAIGSGKFGFPFTQLQADDWRPVLEVNVMGMVNVAHAVAPLMRRNRFGSMVFIASISGQIGSQTDPPYSASKAAGINFAQCMAKDLAVDGVRVNSVCPGMVKTPLNRSVWQAWADRQTPEKRQTYEQWADQKVAAMVPLGRWQQPSDIANMVAFLISDCAAQITGQTINVDGGFVMHW
jgi:2-hydroxycyclohexanecarboxyl-CoA dehydrogenase